MSGGFGKGKALKVKQKTVSKRARSGLVFPISRVHKSMKESGFADRVSETAAVYLTAVLEYLTGELLELAGTAAKDDKKMRLAPKYLLRAIRGDEELSALLRNVQVPEAGHVSRLDTLMHSAEERS